MVSSSKKKRGQQRRAAKSARTATAAVSENPSPNTTPPPPEDISHYFRSGVSSTAMKIGNAFIKQYYKILLTSPSQLHRFYHPDSTVSRSMEPSSPATHSSFSLATTSMNGSDDSPGERVRKAFFGWAGAGLTDEHDDECARVDFEHGAIDAQESINGGILLVVTGHMFLPRKVKSLHFVHTFFLNNNSAPGMKKQFLVKNDILRFLEPVDVEEEEEEDIEEQVSFQIEDSPPIAVAEMGAPRGIAEEPAVVLTGRDEFGPFAHNLLEKGQNHITLRLANDNQLPLVPPTALSIVLNFLKRCEDETFVEVMDSVRLKDEAFMGFRGACCGDLVTPSTWINILQKASSGSSEPRCILQIAENIGPLVRCMCNDMKRLFFKSNKHWKDGILPFVDLIGKMISTSIGSTDENGEDKKSVDMLLTREGLLGSIVQWGYWKREHRPDIVKELDACARVVNIGRNTVRMLVIDAASSTISAAKDKDLLKSIGTTPIVTKEYDPNCMTSFVVGLIRDQKKEGFTSFKPYIASILQPLMEEADCIDKDVIKEMIDLGMKHAHYYETAVVVARLSRFMLCQELNAEEGIESDTRIAFAVRSGIIEMCLNFIDRFGGHEADGSDDEGDSLYNHIESIFNTVNYASLHKKSRKAISHKMVDIRSKLLHSKEIADNVFSVEYEKLLGMIVSILDMNGSYCCRCNKSLSRTEVKLCNGCHRVAYCSRACQKEDWMNGHELACCDRTYTYENVGQFQGRICPPSAPKDERAAAKLEELEVNINMIQLKLFLDHSETILTQAKGLDIPLYDCIVMFNLRYCPPTIEVKKYTDWFETSAEQRGFDETRSKENVTCLYSSFIFNGELDEDDGAIPVLQMQRFFPHEWLTNEK